MKWLRNKEAEIYFIIGKELYEMVEVVEEFAENIHPFYHYQLFHFYWHLAWP